MLMIQITVAIIATIFGGYGLAVATEKYTPKFANWLNKQSNAIIIISVFGVPFIVTVMILANLHIGWTFSNGQRSGELVKFSKKGLIFKTWEGEMMLSDMKTWKFSVRDERLAQLLTKELGHKLTLVYDQELYVPPKLGSTRYNIVNASTNAFSSLEKP